jgi:hypothetical protein
MSSLDEQQDACVQSTDLQTTYDSNQTTILCYTCAAQSATSNAHSQHESNINPNERNKVIPFVTVKESVKCSTCDCRYMWISVCACVLLSFIVVLTIVLFRRNSARSTKAVCKQHAMFDQRCNRRLMNVDNKNSRIALLSNRKAMILMSRRDTPRTLHREMFLYKY